MASSSDLIDRLDASTLAELDRLDFGVIGFDDDERVVVYNTYESETAGLEPNRVLGRLLFTEVAPCTNNFLVAERFRNENPLDSWINYVFTLRMRPTPVRLRMLVADGSQLRYLVVERAVSTRGRDAA